MISYDKTEIKEALTIDNIFELLQEWGGDPEYTDFGLLSSTICHNAPGEGSRKLYYYMNTHLFHCYTGCDDPSFDVFELTRKVLKIQSHKDYDLNEAVRYIAFKFGIFINVDDEDAQFHALPDWTLLNNYDRIDSIQIKNYQIQLKEYDAAILDRFNYQVRITPWLEEGIAQEALDQARIGFFPGNDQITIPHFDKDGRFIGLRGRTLCLEEAERFGKYRPMLVNSQLYNHPLSMNLYNLNHSKDNIRLFGKAIVLESEKSCLQYKSFFGVENDISVACCGSSFSAHQMQLLLDTGVKEVIVAFDRQFQEIGDKEYKHLTANLIRLHNKYKNYATMSFIFDKNKITAYKASPTDEGRDKFLQLFKERVYLK